MPVPARAGEIWRNIDGRANQALFPAVIKAGAGIDAPDPGYAKTE
jgi:hypothetical protein